MANEQTIFSRFLFIRPLREYARTKRLNHQTLIRLSFWIKPAWVNIVRVNTITCPSGFGRAFRTTCPSCTVCAYTLSSHRHTRHTFIRAFPALIRWSCHCQRDAFEKRRLHFRSISGPILRRRCGIGNTCSRSSDRASR